jgi:methyltransferase
MEILSRPLLVLVAVGMMMLGESLISARHERELRRFGAVEPPGDVYATMRWAYPGAFVAMSAEAVWSGAPSSSVALAGLVVLVLAKALKWWAMGSLGMRWTFRVLVLPGAPLVTRGPYAVLRHPNYVAVVGELAAVALLMNARVSGPLVTLLFSLLMWRRIGVENRALGYPPCT